MDESAAAADEHELEVGSPREALRSTLAVGGVDAEQAEGILLLLRDRNLVVHAYNEALAAEVLRRIPAHVGLLQAWLAGLRQNLIRTGLARSRAN